MSKQNKKNDTNTASKYFDRDVNGVVDTRVEMKMYVGVKNSNPNGNPNNEGAPRRNPDGHGFITAVSVKRKVRDTLVEMFGDSLYYEKSSVLENNTTALLKEMGKKAKDFEGTAGEKEFLQEVCKRKIDVRMFGITHTSKPLCRLLGPVVISNGESVLPVKIVHHGITRSSVSSDKSDKTSEENTERAKHAQMGNMALVWNGLYVFNIFVNVTQAEFTGLTWGNLDKFIDVLQSMYQLTASMSRSDVVCERIDVWVHPNKNGACTPNKLAATTKVEPNNDEPTSIEDYTIVPAQHPGVQHFVLIFRGEDIEVVAAE